MGCGSLVGKKTTAEPNTIIVPVSPPSQVQPTAMKQNLFTVSEEMSAVEDSERPPPMRQIEINS